MIPESRFTLWFSLTRSDPEFKTAMSLPCALVHVFEYKSVVHFCGTDGVYKKKKEPPTDADLVLLSDDDEDIFGDCVDEDEPERKRPKADDSFVSTAVEKLYKYKHPAVAFAVSGSSLFSLHRGGRARDKFHVERTDVVNFTCESRWAV